MAEAQKLYVKWAELEKELKKESAEDKVAVRSELDLFRARAWDRTEDQIFVFIMTIALM